MVFDVWELDGQGGKKKRKTRIVNTYDSNIRANQLLGEIGRSIQRRALTNSELDKILTGRTIVLGILNVHSSLWNINCRERSHVTGPEGLIDS